MKVDNYFKAFTLSERERLVPGGALEKRRIDEQEVFPFMTHAPSSVASAYMKLVRWLGDHPSARHSCWGPVPESSPVGHGIPVIGENT